MDKGAHFYRCDLQVHTPRDHAWKGPDCVSEEERQDYARALIKACRDQGLQAIAITDHHDMLFASYIRQAAKEETDENGEPVLATDRIVVFPGMELTLGVPCQALLIFDAEFPDDMFSLAMNALAIAPLGDGEPKTADVERLDHIQSLKSLKSELDKHAYLRARYIIFPNASDNGKFSLLRKGLAGKYTEMPCVGVYVDGELAKLGKGNRDIIAGKAKEWGNKRVACFQTSDNRHHEHTLLGKHSTWVKWAAPTAEALRQACLAEESRISQETPQLPAITVGSVSVSNSAFLGPINLELNPQYNALIGGRGTGKSTILEYLRWALCDQPPGTSDDTDAPNYQARRHRLIEQTLKRFNASVEVRFFANGVPHLVRRQSRDGSVQIKIDDEEFRACTEDEVRGLLPIQAYSQKQLSDVSVRLEELSRFITTPIRGDLNRFERQLEEAAGHIRETHAVRERARSLRKALRERELEASSLAQQAEKLRASLTGLSKEDRGVLDQGPVFESADQTVDGWLGKIRSFGEDARSLGDDAETSRTLAAGPPDRPEKAVDDLKAAHAEQDKLLKEAKAALDKLAKQAEAITKAYEEKDTDTPWGRWAKGLEEFRAAYAQAMERSSVHSAQLKQLRDIESRLSEHQRETARLRAQLNSLGTAETDYQAERRKWRELNEQRDALVDRECDELTKTSAGAIKAQVKRYADASDFTKRLRDAVSGSGMRADKLERFREAIIKAEDPGPYHDALLEELELLAEHDAERDGVTKLPETPTLASAGLSTGDWQRIAKTLGTSDWLAMSLTPIRSVPVFEYRSREGEYIPFSNASAGQQATALLKTLLNQEGPPLVIDQPEEDLDNPVMLEIVQQVWKAKRKRQIVFASHNANLVVNGDAELVVWCDYRSAGDQSQGRIVGEGAIDVPDVREAIKSIMEGGEEAFNLRREKYGF